MTRYMKIECKRNEQTNCIGAPLLNLSLEISIHAQSWSISSLSIGIPCGANSSPFLQPHSTCISRSSSFSSIRHWCTTTGQQAGRVLDWHLCTRYKQASDWHLCMGWKLEPWAPFYHSQGNWKRSHQSPRWFVYRGQKNGNSPFSVPKFSPNGEK